MSHASTPEHPDVHEPPPPAVRVVLLGWCIWLLISWAVTLTLSTTVPAVRGMVMMSLLGLMAIWPTVRLSQAATWRQARGLIASEALLEWVCLLLVFQAVLWPLRLSGNWPLVQAWSLNAAVAGWSLGAAWLVAVGRASDHPVRRLLAVAACLALLFGEPLILAIATTLGAEPWTMVISPLETVYRLTAPSEHYTPGPWTSRALAAFAAAALAWLGLALSLRLRRRV